MKYKKGVEIENATEEEMLRWQMEKIIKASDVIDDESLGECSEALAKLYNSLKYRHAGLFLGIFMSFYLIINFFVLIIKIFWRK